MRDGHTYTIGGVNLIVPVVGLVAGEFVELVHHVIRGAGVHVPGWINRVGWCVSLLDARVLALGSDVGRRGDSDVGSRGGSGRTKVCHGKLALVALAVVADAKAAPPPASTLGGGPNTSGVPAMWS